jgi:hypothetical protein
MIKPKARQRWICEASGNKFICEVLQVKASGYVKLKVVHVISGKLVSAGDILDNELFHEATDQYLVGQDAPLKQKGTK